MSEKIVRDLLMLLSTIDPIGAVLVFAAVAQTQSPAERTRLARRATLIATMVLLTFLVLGQVAFAAMQVSLHSFQLAGGLFLFLFGAQMTFGDIARQAETHAEAGQDPAVFPLAIPSIASPGAILAVVVLTDNARYSLGMQAMTAGILLTVLAVTYLCLRQSDRLLRLLGQNGGAAIIRLLGMVLAALAVEMVLDALGQLGWGPPVPA